MKTFLFLFLFLATSLCLIGCKDDYDKYRSELERKRRIAESAAMTASFTKPTELPADELGKITGRGGMSGDYLQGTLYNGSSYTLAYVDVVLQLEEESKLLDMDKRKRVLRVERLISEKETGADGRTVQRKVASEWPPFTATEVYILTGGFSVDIGTNTFSWGVYNAYGFKR